MQHPLLGETATPQHCDEYETFQQNVLLYEKIAAVINVTHNMQWTSTPLQIQLVGAHAILVVLVALDTCGIRLSGSGEPIAT